jgi:ATP-dependent DNA helicase
MQRATEKKKLEALVIAKGPSPFTLFSLSLFTDGYSPGKFKKPGAMVPSSTTNAAPGGKSQALADLAADLLRLEGEKIDVVPDFDDDHRRVLSDKHLDMLLDRRPAVFIERRLGWTAASSSKVIREDGDREGEKGGRGRGGGEGGEGDEKKAFAVYETPKDQGSDGLAAMMGSAEDD